MKKIIITGTLVLVGGMAGAFAAIFLSSYAQSIPVLSGMDIFDVRKDQAVIVNKTEQVVIEQQLAFQKAYEKNVPAIVAVKSVLYGNTQVSGVGFIVSSDGLVVTRREWVSSATGSKAVVTRGENDIPADVVKVSEERGLVLLKIKASGLPVVSFAKNEERKLGEEVFLIGMKRGTKEMISFVNAGVIKSIDGDFMETNIMEDFRLATGTPLFTITGDVLGINSVNSAGYVFAISSDAITKFLY